MNCSHILWPYRPGVNTNHQPQYAPEEAIANGKLVQQQRAKERSIRDAKRRLEAAKQLDDEEQVNHAKTLIRARQAKLRQFIKDTNEDKGKQILVRDYDREQIGKQ
ncbi:phage minor capsid protein [Limosilactobacillus reuteri]|uniref:phage minor capsid protein n=1 Tax=Limosilactobacillus reuteri TaxID=1598 RepID=UPI000A31FCDF|nr:phage minor capsid protein [Limosilactobacillus reuteri]